MREQVHANELVLIYSKRLSQSLGHELARGQSDLSFQLHYSSLHLQQSGVGCVRVPLQHVYLALQSLELSRLRPLGPLHFLLRLEFVAQHRVLGLRNAHLDDGTRSVFFRADDRDLLSVILELAYNVNEHVFDNLEVASKRDSFAVAVEV